MLKEKRIAFIGGGNMAEAMIRGLIAQQVVTPLQIIASDPLPQRREQLSERHQIQTTDSNQTAVAAADLVVLAIKPQIFAKVVPDIQGRIPAGALLISIMAGMPIAKIKTGTEHQAIVRSMPNTPAMVNQGMTVWTGTAVISDAQKAQAQQILGSFGKEIYVDDEHYIDMATALNGSGPAYFFLIMEAFIDAGVHLGFSRQIAAELVLQTMKGSVIYAQESGNHLAELRNQVTSPAGTTAAGLYSLEKGGIRPLISRSVWAAYQRANALGSGES